MDNVMIYGMTLVAIYVLGCIALIGGNDLHRYVRWTLWTIVSILSGTLLLKLLITLILDT